MNVVVNGADTEVATGTMLAAVLEPLGLPERGIAVAVDRTVVPRSRWGATELGPGAVVEVVTAVAGG